MTAASLSDITVSALPMKKEESSNGVTLASLFNEARTCLEDITNKKQEQAAERLLLRPFHPTKPEEAIAVLKKKAGVKVVIGQGTAPSDALENHRTSVEMSLSIASVKNSIVVPVLSGKLPPLERFSRSLSTQGLAIHVENDSTHSSESLCAISGAAAIVSQRLTLGSPELFSNLLKSITVASRNEQVDIRDIVRDGVLKALKQSPKHVNDWAAFELIC